MRYINTCFLSPRLLLLISENQNLLYFKVHSDEFPPFLITNPESEAASKFHLYILGFKAILPNLIQVFASRTNLLVIFVRT